MEMRKTCTPMELRCLLSRFIDMVLSPAVLDFVQVRNGSARSFDPEMIDEVGFP